MASTSKLSFRARNLDANRGMKVFFADELPDISECAPINRGVNPMPTGMEKEEEMETHLQDAIHAQQASTSGISDNHVIPTPKVLYIEDDRYDLVYPVQPPCKAQLMKVQAWLSMEREEAEYDMDSEDEEYLRDKPHINSRDLERIMECLEGQSDEKFICQPASARKLLMPHFDDNVIDDVYDYWLAKRKEAATQKILGFGGLIPKIRTECRKENEKLNPYVAFRRRAEKMQTRKNRKNDEDSYEKVLRLGHDLRRAVHLFEMVKRREKSKLAMIDLDAEILSARATLGDYGSVVYNQILAKLQPEEEEESVPRVPPNGSAASSSVSCAASSDTALQPLRGEENGVKRKKMRKRISAGLAGLTGRSGALSAQFDRDLPNKAWLKKNAEVWNQSPTSFISGMGGNDVKTAVEQVDQSVAAANTANADGRYAFKRRRGCHYRPPAPLREKNGAPPSLDSIPPERRFYYVSMPSTSRESVVAEAPTTPAAGPAPKRSLLLRRRIGRGGRVVFDQFPQPAKRAAAPATAAAAPQKSSYVAGRTSGVIYDPFELDCVAMESEETSKWEAILRPSLIESEEEDVSFPPVSSRYLYSRRYQCRWRPEDEETDAVAEREWLASAVSPAPLPDPPTPAADATTAAVEPPSPKRAAPQPRARPGGPSPPSEHEGSPAPSPASKPQSAQRKQQSPSMLKSNGAAAPATAAAMSRIVQQQPPQPEESTMDEEGAESSSESPMVVEDSPASSSEHDNIDQEKPLRLLPLGEGAAPAHLLHLTQGNASVLSPPDSTAPSPRVCNGSASAPGAAPLAAPAPHSNGHNGHAGSGNGGGERL
ncbi:hypothetical protein PENTCL1PPCAC_12221 [Pristionchus entomophagus]|uniref:Enhancer of polycomb-like protein n=1 Tax=Pristionchus entomophagus TaxID=358040 RepID=A0AAV5T3F7_9BILA|nr:hypothetical protein PENTCL1PPCAC_12221 [Pristionchus entomophagus]